MLIPKPFQYRWHPIHSDNWASLSLPLLREYEEEAWGVWPPKAKQQLRRWSIQHNFYQIRCRSLGHNHLKIELTVSLEQYCSGGFSHSFGCHRIVWRWRSKHWMMRIPRWTRSLAGSAQENLWMLLVCDGFNCDSLWHARLPLRII